MTISQSEKPIALFVGPFPPPYGGIATHLVGLTRYLADNGFDSYVLTFTSDGQAKNEVVKDGIFATSASVRPKLSMIRDLARAWKSIPSLILLFGAYPRPRHFISMLLRSLHVTTALRRWGLQTVSIYGTDEGDIIPFVRRLNPGAYILYTVFAAPFMWPDHYRQFRGFYNMAVREADYVLASSDYCACAAKQLAEDIGVKVVYYGVDTERFNPRLDPILRRRQPSLEGKLLILLLARMEPEMGFPVGLQIAHEVNARRDDTVFVFAGAHGSLTDKVAKEAAESGGRIIYAVDIPSDELPAYYASADIIMAPTMDKWACMGLSIKEALASGRPVVASRVGGIPEAVRDGVEGFLVSPDETDEVDCEGFAAAISRLCDDAELRSAMGRKARERAEEVFSIERTHESIHRLLLLRG